MGVLHWTEVLARALSICDIGILKRYCTLFGVPVGAHLSPYAELHLWWFFSAVVVLGGYLLFRWFTARTL